MTCRGGLRTLWAYRNTPLPQQCAHYCSSREQHKRLAALCLICTRNSRRQQKRTSRCGKSLFTSTVLSLSSKSGAFLGNQDFNILRGKLAVDLTMLSRQRLGSRRVKQALEIGDATGALSCALLFEPGLPLGIAPIDVDDQ